MCGFNELLIGGFSITAEVKTTPTKEREQTMFNTNIVKKWNYGNYSNNNYGSHSLAFSDNFGNDYYFSYDTLIAFRGDEGLVIHQNNWGTTTGKHLNWINSDKKIRVNSEVFQAKLEALRNKYNAIDKQ